MDKSTVEYEHGRIAVGALTKYSRNARTHSAAQVSQLVASMREWGFTNPVLIDEANVLVAGHGRVLAAEVLGLESVPFIRLAGLTDAQRRAYVLADNKLALNSGWDDALLKSEMSTLEVLGFDLGLTGFSSEELAAHAAPKETGKDPDAAPPPDETREPISKPGDVWVLGAHRVVCGDSTNSGTLASLMQGELADVVWTDPPYNVAYEGSAGKIKNDDMAAEKFRAFLVDLHRVMFDAMKPGASLYVAHSDTEGFAFRNGFETAGFKLSGCLVWRKDALVLGRSDYQWIHEPILYGWKPGKAHRWFGGRKQTTLQASPHVGAFVQREDGRWQVTVGDQVLLITGEAQVEEVVSSIVFEARPKRSDLHPTMKPVALIEKMLKNSALPGDVVLDVCGGSGSTLVAADRLGMRARIVELDPKFVDVIVRRWQEYSGQRARHARTDQPFVD